MENEEIELARAIATVSLFMEDLLIDTFAMYLFLRKRGLYSEFKKDEALAEEAKKVLSKAIAKMEGDRHRAETSTTY